MADDSYLDDDDSVVTQAAEKAGARMATLDAKGKGSLTDAAATAPAGFDTVLRDKDNLAALLYTSGTTGLPKPAVITSA